jgi:hypothetical protein
MRQTTEYSVELTTQELLTPPEASGLVEIEDVCEVNSAQAPGIVANTALPADGDPIEIELTAEEMDAMLQGRIPG